jgi:hypothetical protein
MSIPAFQSITNRVVGVMQDLLIETPARQDIVSTATHRILQSIFSPQQQVDLDNWGRASTTSPALR